MGKTDIRVRSTPAEKKTFEQAAKKARQSLNQWLISAGVDRARRDAQPVKP